jgi:hypothetical protein
MTNEEYKKIVEHATMLIDRGYVQGISLMDLVKALISGNVQKGEMNL